MRTDCEQKIKNINGFFNELPRLGIRGRNIDFVRKVYVQGVCNVPNRKRKRFSITAKRTRFCINLFSQPGPLAFHLTSVAGWSDC